MWCEDDSATPNLLFLLHRLIELHKPDDFTGCAPEATYTISFIHP
jgi:hypothetical protein